MKVGREIEEVEAKRRRNWGRQSRSSWRRKRRRRGRRSWRLTWVMKMNILQKERFSK